MCLEPHGVTARFEAPDRATVWASTQATFGARGEVARVLEVPEANVTVIAHFMGGGFGSKFSLGVAGAAACTLSKELGRPVKLMLERRAEHAQGGNRPSSVQEMTLGVKKDGTLAAYKVAKSGTGGIGGGAGAANPMIYDFGAVAEADFEVATNAGAAAAMRAPRHPQGSFALETILNMAAEAVGMDPLELRRKNDKHPIRARQYVEGAKRFGWGSAARAVPARDRSRRNGRRVRTLVRSSAGAVLKCSAASARTDRWRSATARRTSASGRRPFSRWSPPRNSAFRSRG
jgi:xanthine dehydrogenase YagR molybdenum-binding subunit